MKTIFAATLAFVIGSASQAATRDECVAAAAATVETVIATHAKLTDTTYAASRKLFFAGEIDRIGQTIEARADFVERARVTVAADNADKVCAEAGLLEALSSGKLADDITTKVPTK